MTRTEAAVRSGADPTGLASEESIRAPAPTRSHWFPVVMKVAGIAALLIGLAGIGAASMVLGDGGVAVARGAAPEASGGWLAGAPAAEPPTAVGGSARKQHSGPADSRKPPSAALTADGKVILNLAEVDDLRRLPGIGRRRAEAILELRARLKRFRRVTELLRVRGIGVRGLRRITPLVVLDPPKSGGNAGADAGADAAKGDAGS